MTTPTKTLARQQLSRTLERYRPFVQLAPPQKGWLRAIRSVLGMTVRQYAQRLGATPSRITKLEQSEVNGSVTLKSLKRAAEALDCVVVYAIMPRDSLDAMVRKQAEAVINERYHRVAHTMVLEDQAVSREMSKEQFDSAVDELIRRAPKDFWGKRS